MDIPYKKILKSLRELRNEIEELLIERYGKFGDYNKLRDLANDRLRFALAHMEHDNV